MSLLAALALGGCDRAPRSAPAPSATVAGETGAEPLASTGEAEAAVAEALPSGSSIVLASETIEVAGEPACALTVRYSEGLEQPVTWRGEGCEAITVKPVSLPDLAAIRQDGKLDAEAREDLAALPGERALYIEGSHASALYPANVMGRIYEVPLAD